MAPNARACDPNGERSRSYWLDGYFFRNLGDDLMVLELLRQNTRDEFYATGLTGGNGASLRRAGNLHTLSGFRAKVKALTGGVDGYVIVGGSMFMDRKGSGTRHRLRMRALYLRRLLTMLLMRSTGREAYILGCNIGPIETRLGGLLFGALFRSANHITVRDADSAAYLSGRTIDHQLAPDMVFSWLNSTQSDVGPRAQDETIGLSVMDFPGQPRSYTLAAYRRLIDGILNWDPRTRVCLLGFQDSPLMSDTALISDLIRESDPARVSSYTYIGDVEEFVAVFSQCSRVIGTRFHSIILALGLGIPCSVISYSPKTDNALGDLRWNRPTYKPERLLGSSDAERLVEEIMTARPTKVDVTSAALHASALRKGA